MGFSEDRILISPSGNLYGSERVLLDYLYHSNRRYTIYVPRNSLLYDQMAGLKTCHCIKQYNPGNLKWFYCRIFLTLLFRGVKMVYINEAGHIRYIKAIAYIFRKVRFIVHIRMVYDAEPNRLGLTSVPNIRLIAVSEYVAGRIPSDWNRYVIYDPFLFTTNPDKTLKGTGRPERERMLRIGIIGRISSTKGFMDFALLLEKLELRRISHFEFNFYGSFANDEEIKEKAAIMLGNKFARVYFRGFVNQEEIYRNIDCVCHFCQDEGLGRIFFESINEGIPFLGFRKGGLTEIADAFQLMDFLIDKNDEWVDEFIRRLFLTKNNYEAMVNQVLNARKQFSNKFLVMDYLNKIEDIISLK